MVKPETLTIPRKELCGALMLAKLLTTVGEALGIPQDHIHGWTDSSIVLSWLDGHPRDFDVFVTNRVASILQLTTPHSWKHVPTLQNPADCASRGMMPQELLAHSLWWEGPSWLLVDPVDTPWQPPRRPLAAPERRHVHVSSTIPPQWIEGRYESYHRCILVTAWCLRYIHRYLYRLRQKKPPEEQPIYMTSTELVAAEHLLVKLSQARSFPKDRQQLLSHKPVLANSKLRALSPYLDKEQLLRVGGRLSNSALTHSQQHPLITSGRDILVTMLFNYLHIRLGHCGPTLLLCAAGTRFHVLGARTLSRDVCRQCITCRKVAPKPLPQYMADLPPDRVNQAPAFTVTGVDFAGPVTLKKGHTRRPVYIKAYVAVFICFKTRATHLEVVSDLTTAAFLACLKRFVSRRGIPVTLQSDNGSNFKGARNQLQELYRFLEQEHSKSLIHQQLLEDKITWKMIPEWAPHFGGLWEAAVKSMKHHLKRIVGSKPLTFEELTTVTCQIEACLNSRPILAVTKHNEEGIFTLTSGHFLIGRAIKSYPEKHIPEDISLLKRWNLGQAMVQHFWTRWSNEYLKSLQARTKWHKKQPNLEVGDVIILKEDQTFACNWPLARMALSGWPSSELPPATSRGLWPS